MRLVHKWPDGDSMYIKALYGLRKSYSFKKENSVKVARKDSQSRCSKACPIYEWRAVVKNKSRHLQIHHKIEKDCTAFQKLIVQAKTVEFKSKKSKVLVEKREASYAYTILCGPLLSEDSDDSLHVLNAYEESNSSSDTSNISADGSDTMSVSSDMVSDKNNSIVVSDSLSKPEKLPEKNTSFQDEVIGKGSTDFQKKIIFKEILPIGVVMKMIIGKITLILKWTCTVIRKLIYLSWKMNQICLKS